jgi:hypothetical protein
VPQVQKEPLDLKVKQVTLEVLEQLAPKALKVPLVPLAPLDGRVTMEMSEHRAQLVPKDRKVLLVKPAKTEK